MRLQRKHLEYYLPYHLRFIDLTENNFYSKGKPLELGGIHDSKNAEILLHRHGDALEYSSISIENTLCKPALYPISSVNKPIKNNGHEVVPNEIIFHRNPIDYTLYFEEYGPDIYTDLSIRIYGYCSGYNAYILNLDQIQQLFKWRLDVWGLIPAGLAIDVNTLPVNPYE